jgi:DNA-binding LytR/AlgR family response regulator
MRIIEEQSPQLVFLDIQMPVMSGIDFIKTSPNISMVIITTAFPDYALEGFQLDVMDYLVKPITFNRFVTAVNKVKDYHTLVTKSSATKTLRDYFFIKCGYKFEKICYDDILYIEAMQNYVDIYTVAGKFITLMNLKTVEQNLEGHPFIRVHKSYIISISRIEAIDDNEIIIQSSRIPISRQYRSRVIDKVVYEKLWKKIP